MPGVDVSRPGVACIIRAHPIHVAKWLQMVISLSVQCPAEGYAVSAAVSAGASEDGRGCASPGPGGEVAARRGAARPSAIPLATATQGEYTHAVGDLSTLVSVRPYRLAVLRGPA
ncbi:hypothetical protein FRAAL0047 [Frankia alni ACN14a]|uniref:Uncharacterized protein n=1 Tax=Frankia alni (strain DSM 45986 / CECT 9034 / ACN14a) TaxID=326424 RepID=Q0RUK9_FRAAA|nr:hypothetical protein FRAAL0047 [Frankia alni ACN14a]